MNIENLTIQLKEDAARLSSENERKVSDFMKRISDISQCQEGSVKIREMSEVCLDFYDYTCDHPDWTVALPRYNINSEEVEPLCYAAQAVERATDVELDDNEFFLAGMMQLLTVFQYDNMLERAYAADSLEGWTHCFDEAIHLFFIRFLNETNEMPCKIMSLPEDLSPEECLLLFRLEMERARNSFVRMYPEYNRQHGWFEEGEFQRFLMENFEGKDPDPKRTFGDALCRRLLLYIEWRLFSDNIDD